MELLIIKILLNICLLGEIDMTIITEKDGSFTINADWYQKQYFQLLDQYKMLEEECKALREQINELQ